MPQLDLATICATAFISVFALLTLLAFVMQLITRLFPVAKHSVDAIVVAAIDAAVNHHFPGAQVTRIEEKQ
ncbi:hypothetical protein KQI63_16410 [bacterium]|nr:hypothetical protein [bacterium]